VCAITHYARDATFQKWHFARWRIGNPCCIPQLQRQASPNPLDAIGNTNTGEAATPARRVTRARQRPRAAARQA